VFNGFNELRRLHNCTVFLNGINQIIVTKTIGFARCKGLEQCTCIIEEMKSDATNAGNVCFDHCSVLNNCEAYIQNNRLWQGFANSVTINSCRVLVLQPSMNHTGGLFYGCSYLNNCIAFIHSGAVNAYVTYSYSLCNEMDNCIAAAWNSANSISFNVCTHVLHCSSRNRSLGSMQFANCTGIDDTAIANNPNGTPEQSFNRFITGDYFMDHYSRYMLYENSDN
jgi:hypothetical protein